MPKKSKPKRKTTKTGKIHDGNYKRRKTKTQSGRGPGKPTISDDELVEQRSHWAFALENHWGDVGWNLKCARTVEDIRLALQPLSKGPDLYPLSLLLRPTTEAGSAGAISETKRKLGASVQRLYEAHDLQRKAAEAFQKAESAALEFSDKIRQQLQAEIEIRKGNIRDLRIKISDKNVEIRRTELHLKKATEQDRPSLETESKSLQVELEQIEKERRCLPKTASSSRLSNGCRLLLLRSVSS